MDGRYIPVPMIIAQSTLSAGAKLLYGVLVFFCGPDKNHCHPTQPIHLNAMGLPSRRSLVRWMRELTDTSLVAIEKRADHPNANIYTLPVITKVLARGIGISKTRYELIKDLERKCNPGTTEVPGLPNRRSKMALPRPSSHARTIRNPSRPTPRAPAP